MTDHTAALEAAARVVAGPDVQFWDADPERRDRTVSLTRAAIVAFLREVGVSEGMVRSAVVAYDDARKAGRADATAAFNVAMLRALADEVERGE